MSFSHVTLRAPPSVFARTVQFYSASGLRILQHSSECVWLSLPPFALQVVHCTDHPLLLDDSDALLLDRHFSIDDDDFSAFVSFADADIQALANIYDALDVRYRIVKHFTASNKESLVKTLLVLDPLGNLVAFNDYPHAFATPPPAKPTAGTIASQVIDKEYFKPDPVPLNKQRRATMLLEEHKPMASEWALVNDPEDEKAGKIQKKNIGILTSGGDCSGMNAAVRAICRISLQRHCTPFAIYEGYQGLVEGGKFIRKMGWEDVRGIMSVGGTTIGTARCLAFRSREGRLNAAYNMIKNGIDALIVVGGDGSLTGGDLLRDEWPGLVKELIEMGRVTEDECASIKDHLHIVGLVGSIDNDMAATDITIGAVTSLHRICEALDSLTSTAMSHQRAFVVEVMGRHCGWLALMAAIAVGADWVFLPERPPPLDQGTYGDNWEDEMCEKVKKQRDLGNRKTLVIIAEGAIDRNLNPIKPDDVKKVLEVKLGLDTRVTTLGHVQRGGTPCAYDRYLATVQGVEAVEAVLRSTPDIPPPMIGMSQNKITNVPLMEAVKLTHGVSAAIAKKDFAKAMELRDPDFHASFDAYIESTLMATGPGAHMLPENKRLRIGIMHTGAPAGGMNAATRMAVRLCLNRGHTALGIWNGFSGLVRDDVRQLTWQQVDSWQTKGGSELGTNRDHPEPLASDDRKFAPKGANFIDCGVIAYHMQKLDIQGLLIIGGFEAYTSVLTLCRARKQYPAFCIPMVHLPATVSNNVPGTDFSLGSDTALNAIVEACDRIKLSANASRKRVFVVEVQGGNCGYLAVMGGLAVGAVTVYIPEEGISIGTLEKDIRHLCRRYHEDKLGGVPSEGRLVLKNEEVAKDTYPTEVLSKILKAEGKGLFDSRTAVLGHLQQGGIPSPLDRIRATKLAVHCIDWIEECAEKSKGFGEEFAVERYTIDPQHCAVIGIRGARTVFTSVEELMLETDAKKRRSKKELWWSGLPRLVRILAKYEYFDENEPTETDAKL